MPSTEFRVWDDINRPVSHFPPSCFESSAILIKKKKRISIANEGDEEEGKEFFHDNSKGRKKNLTEKLFLLFFSLSLSLKLKWFFMGNVWDFLYIILYFFFFSKGKNFSFLHFFFSCCRRKVNFLFLRHQKERIRQNTTTRQRKQPKKTTTLWLNWIQNIEWGLWHWRTQAHGMEEKYI